MKEDLILTGLRKRGDIMTEETNSGWPCPACGSKRFGVVNSHMITVTVTGDKQDEEKEEPARRRYRECSDCLNRFVTIETLSHKVQKRA